MLSDFKAALRQLQRSPGFAATVLAIFALCIGTNALIFAVVHTILLKPLPFPDPDSLVTTLNAYPKMGMARMASSPANYYERRDLPAFSSVAAYKYRNVVVGDVDSPERVPVFRITPSFFKVLGVSAIYGRLFLENEGEPGNDNVIVLSNGFFHHRFNGDPSIIGKTVAIDGAPNIVIGVLPANFSYLGMDVRLWQPLAFSAEDRSVLRRHSNIVYLIARLRSGFSLAEAQTEVNSLNRRLEKEDPSAKFFAAAGFHTDVVGLRANYVATIRPSLLLLQTGAIFLLLIGIVNLANLLMVRASVRIKELAVRQVLGASWARVVVQPTLEMILLAAVGGVLGLVLGAAGLRLFSALGIKQLPFGREIALDIPVALASLSGSLIVGFLLAIPAAAMSRKRDLAPALGGESRSGTTNRATHRLRHSLIVAQVALAFVLLTSAGLLGLSFQRVLAAPLGFRQENILTGEVTLPSNAYKDIPKRLAFTEKLLDEMRYLPGITDVGVTTTAPVPNAVRGGGAVPWIEGYSPPAGATPHPVNLHIVGGNYLSAIGIPLRAGRYLTFSDLRSKISNCVVDADFARRYWPGGSAIGHHLGAATQVSDKVGYQFHIYTVVGVVGAIKQADTTDVREEGDIYLAYCATAAPPEMIAVMRTVQKPSLAAAAMRQAVLRADPAAPVSNIKTLTDLMDDHLAARRSTVSLAAIFAGMSLILTAVGVYGVIAYTVRQRQREIGVRMAMGARPSQIFNQFLLLGGRHLLIGIGLGLLGAWLAGRGLSSLLYGVTPFDAEVLLTTSVILSAVVLLAGLIPSRHAAHISPIEALRSD